MYDRVADLPLRIDDVRYRRHERETSSGFTRVTTEVVLEGGDRTGRGEDVTYEAADHDRFEGVDPVPTGRFTVDSFSDRLDGVQLFASPPEQAASRNYRRWAVESAALDLALRQAETNPGAVLERTYDPVRFVVSRTLRDPETGEVSAAPVHRFRERNPDVEFKLDPTPEWDRELLEDLAATGAVRVLDLKGYYDVPEVENPADPNLYRRVLEAFPEAIIEDVRFTDETESVLAEHADRLSWDYPITEVASVRDLPVEPAWLNVKPSRFGTVESLFSTVAFCERHGIALYGGGQFELSVGRGQIQALASLLYPTGPNDVAPGGYNDPDPDPDLPTSPLTGGWSDPGFGRH